MARSTAAAVQAPAPVVAEVGKPTKGVKPNCNGVPGALIEASELPPDLVFGLRKQHVSPYDALLKQLLESGEGKALSFGHERARASVFARSKKLGIKIEMADHAGKLYVRLMPGSTASSTEEKRPLKESEKWEAAV